MGEENIREIMVLGSVPSLGRVILFDNMEELFKWVEGGTGGDTTFEKNNTVAYNGSNSLHIKTRVTGAQIGDTVSATRYGVQRPGKRYRLELLWHHVSSALVEGLSFGVTIQDGTDNHFVRLAYSVENNLWKYYGTDGAYHAISGGAQNLDEDGWHRVLMEFDQNKKEYIRLISDGLPIDLRGIGYHNPGGGNLVQLKVLLELWTVTAAACESYFDDVLVMEI